MLSANFCTSRFPENPIESSCKLGFIFNRQEPKLNALDSFQCNCGPSVTISIAIRPVVLAVKRAGRRTRLSCYLFTFRTLGKEGIINANMAKFIIFDCCTAVNIKIIVFWHVSPCCRGGRYQRFGGMCCLHLECRRSDFNPEDEGSTFLRNFDTYLPGYVASLPRRLQY
jgi:hypothetical protein